VIRFGRRLLRVNGQGLSNLPNWWDAYEDKGTPKSQAPAQSPWQSFVSAITNRDWGQTLENVGAGAAHGGADLVGMLEGGLNNPITNPGAAANVGFNPPGSISDLAALLTGRQTPLANKLQGYVPQVAPQDKGDVYAGRAAEGAVSGLPFGGLGALSGATSGIGGQAGRDLTGGSDIGDLIGQVVGGAVPLAPHTITSVRGARYIRAGLAQPDLHDALAITAYSESRNNPNAVSPKGAKGVMQVMDATARKPGHGIAPSDGTPADTARVGRQLFTALLGKYDGDYGKAWAAYNWGERHIDKFGDNWYDHAPAETKKYVSQNLKLLGRDVPSEHPGDVPDHINMSDPSMPEQSPNDRFATEDAQLLDGLHSHDSYDESYGHPDEHLDLNNDFFLHEMVRRHQEDPNYTPTSTEQERLDEIKQEDPGSHWGNYEAVIGKNVVRLDPNEMRPTIDSVHRKIDSHITEMEDMVKSGDHDVTPDEIAQLRNEIVAPFEKAGAEIPPEIQEHADRLDALYRQVGKDSSHEKFTGYPRDYHPANDPREPTLATPGKTLHEYTDAEWKNLTEYQQKALVDKANEKLFNKVPPEGKTLHEYTDAEWKKLNPYQRKTLIDQANEKIFNKSDKLENDPEHDRLAEAVGTARDKYENFIMHVAEPKPKTRMHAAWKKQFEELGKAVQDTRDAYYSKYPSDIYGNGGKPVVERDSNPPAESGSFGTRRPRGIVRKPVKSPEGHEFEPDKPTLNKNRRKVVDKLADAITQTKPIRQDFADMLTKERARRLAAIRKIRAADGGEGGEAGFYKELHALKGSMGKPKFESIRHWFDQKEIEHMMNMVNKSDLDIYQSIKAKTALKKLLGEDYGEVPNASELKELQKVLPLEGSIWKQLLENEEGTMHLPEGAMKVSDVMNFSRTMRSSFDLSAPFRQGVFMVGSKSFWKNIPEMVKMFGNQKYYEQEMRRIRLDPDYEMAKEAKLALIDHTNPQISEHEEAFMSRLATKIPGVKMSERAYTGFLNKLRFDTFKSYMDLARKGGIPLEPKRIADMGRFINSATGRGDLGKYGNMAAPFLSGGLFSPRLMASRINLLMPIYYIRLDPFVRRQAMKSLMSFTLIAATTLGLLKAGGAKVDTDWRHPGPDFGKAVIGDTHIDALGGFQQYIRFGLELITGMQKSQNGTVKEINKENAGPFDPTYASVAGHFLRSKLAPVPSVIADYANDKKDFLGRPMTVSNEVQNLFVPMALQDLHDAYKSYGVGGAAAVAVPDILGVGVNTYSPKPPKGKSNFGFGKDFKDPFGKEFGSQFPKEFK
jgi:hypothetical protein